MLIPSWITNPQEIEDPFGYGERAVSWLRKLKHPKNPAPGHPFQLDEWQENVIRRIYGPRKADGSRIVRRVTLLLPRGNRKTSLCAAITLLHLMGPERQPGGLIVSAASAREQALELFNEAALIVNNDGRMAKHMTIREGNNNTITFNRDRVRYKAVASDGKVQHGKTPNVVIADELHAWEGNSGKKQWEALDSALVKVPGTLLIVATTSGRGQENLAWKTVEEAIKVQKGEIDDPAQLPVVFMAEKDDDWKDEALWYAVNPGMKHGYPDLESYRDKAKQAIHSPFKRDGFLQYNLNVWLDHSASPFVEMSVYDKGKGAVDLQRFADEKTPCWLAVDMGLTTDLTAVVACWGNEDDGYSVWPWFFCPGDNLRTRAERDGVPYPSWAEDGFIIPTDGNVTNYRTVEQHIRDLCKQYNVQEIAFDPAYAQQVMGPLTDDGFPTATMRQGWITMAPAIKELERIIVGNTLAHGGHPVLRWNFDNVVVQTDSAGNRMFHKGKSRDRIDGAVACAMAVARCAAGDPGTSGYETANDDFGLWAYVD